MHKRICSLLLVVCMVLTALVGLTSCDDDPPATTPQKLSAPVVTLTDNVATWSADSNADKFEISLDGNLSYVENSVTSKTLTNGQTLKVRAVGDGSTYSTSDWSNSVTYMAATPAPQPTKLGTPSVTISADGLASWTAVSNASSYIYKINGGAETPTTATSVQLTNGQSIVVKAVGDGTNYTDGDYSASQTYTASTPPAPQPTKLGTPSVTISADGLASWTAVSNASSYIYKINGGAETPTTATSVQLTDGQSIVVKAVGDGTNYTDGDYSASHTYTASNPPAPQPTKLGTPNVTISADGLASWTAVANASSYVYKINGGAEIPTTATSVQLADGQSIVVKAVGDGTNYTDGDYSASKTYTASTPAPTSAPTYLGIFASNNEPSQADGLPEAFVTRPMMMSFRMMRAGSYRQFGTALNEYFGNSNNHFNANYPVASDYDVYARSGEMVYIQIWLNNPNQYTILSLKLNGTKYQVGGGLSSFFIEDNGQRYNCIYVAVTIPNGTYAETTYTVTDIEYIANTYINADGTDEFMNNNDTVSIGLPYNAQNPTISDFNPTSLTVNSCSATLNVADASGLVGLSGGWLGVAVYDGYNIIVNQALTIGSNTISATGLVENTSYWITVYLYADLHDGNGVTAHILFEQTIRTPEAITVGEVQGTLLYDSVKDGYYGAIKVNTTLNSNTAEYIKLEILKDDEVVYTDTSFNGTATVSNGILCGNSYTVRVYYKDTEYPEGKYIEESAWINYLGNPWYQEAGGYAFVNDAVYYFQLSNGDANYPIIDSFTLKLYNKESARWVASDVLYILNNPTAIEDLNAQIDALREQFNAAYGNNDLMWSINQQISALEEQLDPLEYAQWYLENRADNNRDIAFWQAEAAKGKYYYEFEYNGTDTEKIFKVGKTYYVVLDDALLSGLNGFDVQIDYKYDKQEGGDLTDGVINESFNIQMLNYYNGTEVRDVVLNGNTLTFSLVNVDHYPTSNSNGETSYNIGYVYKITARNDAWEEVVLYEIGAIPTFNVDEAAWFAEYVRRIKAGESVDGLYDIYVPKYEDSYSITLDLSGLGAGSKNITIYTRKMSEVYEDGEYDREIYVQIGIYTQLPTPSIEFTEYEGRVVHDWLSSWFGEYSYEAKDQNGNPVTILSEGGSSFNLPAPGTQVRVKLMANGYWLESEWSEWYTFGGLKVAAPTLGEYSTAGCTISWSLDNAENVSHFIYTINDGTPVRVELNGTRSVFLNDGDVFRVKCVPNGDAMTNGYVDSAWMTYVCTDARQKLGTPTNIRFEYGSIVWDVVEGAAGYIVEQDYNGRVQSFEIDYNSWSAKIGATYKVRAVPNDAENYKLSDWSEPYLFTVTLGNPEFQQIRREKVYWTSVEHAQGYYYKIGENGEVNTVRNYYLALSEIPVGEKLYVQAYAEGCTSSEWVMIYHNVTKLATPDVTVSSGTASWSAIENAEGYLYKINGGEEIATTDLFVSGLHAGDTITVCATIDEFGYGNSDWSEVKTQLPIMSAPVLDTSLLVSEGTVSWSAVDGATSYEYDLGGSVNATWEMSVTDIQYGQSFKIRAVCDNGEYEFYGEWCEVVIRVDTREQLATPVIAYDPEVGLTVAINDPKVSHYEVMFGQDGYTWSYYPPDGAYEVEVITNSFAFPENDNTVYVKAVSNDGNYRDSEWATLTITFDF